MRKHYDRRDLDLLTQLDARELQAFLMTYPYHCGSQYSGRGRPRSDERMRQDFRHHFLCAVSSFELSAPFEELLRGMETTRNDVRIIFGGSDVKQLGDFRAHLYGRLRGVLRVIRDGLDLHEQQPTNVVWNTAVNRAVMELIDRIYPHRETDAYNEGRDASFSQDLWRHALPDTFHDNDYYSLRG